MKPIAGSTVAAPLEVLQSDAAPGANALARLLDAPQKTRIALKSVLEPVVIGGKADQHAGRFRHDG